MSGDHCIARWKRKEERNPHFSRDENTAILAFNTKVLSRVVPMVIGVCEQRLANVISGPLESCGSLINEPMLESNRSKNGHVEFTQVSKSFLSESIEKLKQSCMYCYVSENILKISYLQL